MFRLLKFLFYLAVLGGLGLVGYAYVAPIFGVDFRPPVEERSVPIDLALD